ncbi:DMT family transporter [Brevibacillus ruminantium]|uniref:DMT family transporter n=1 Tax=Brevibacillus ruminantium TaxID=2950604 RepID=A0ABY4WJY5_9BACL|nr:DMT family transporter [Brevibacillus ruminantium]USG66175.1 DMT family transporter [Brevibacillus ruminantium]
MDNNSIQKAYLAAIINALIVGLSFLFVKVALTSSSPLDTLAHRFTFSFLAASVPLLFGWIRLNTTLRDMVSFLPVALFYPVLFFSLQAFGLVYTSSSEAGIIQATVPIFTMILAAYFLKEQTSRAQKVFTMLSVAGVIYIFASKGVDLKSANMTGTALIFLSALSLAGYNVLARKVVRRFHFLDVTYVMTVFGFLFFNGMSVVQHISAGTLTTFFQPLTQPSFLISVLYLGILSSLVTSFLSNYALSKIEASKMSVFNQISTLVTIIAGVIWLQEELKMFHLVGGALIVIGVVGSNFYGAKKAQVPKEQPLDS